MSPDAHRSVEARIFQQKWEWKSVAIIHGPERHRRRMNAQDITEKKPPFAKLSKVLTRPDLPLKANERIVALVMFQHVRMTDMKCWPSIDTICRRAKVSRHTVARTIKLLQELGLMTLEKQRSKGKFDRNVYDFSNVKKYRDRVSR